MPFKHSEVGLEKYENELFNNINVYIDLYDDFFRLYGHCKCELQKLGVVSIICAFCKFRQRDNL
jgi:hypothetical protein